MNTSSSPIRVTVWGENRHEKTNPIVAKLYPRGMHEAIADGLRPNARYLVTTATLDDPEHGLTADRVAQTDVLLWWGHLAHDAVADAVVERVYQRVLGGMGLIVLHSGHFSKIFKKLMGTTCDLKWRDDPANSETLWVTDPGHPILAGIYDHFTLPQEEMYGEYFDVPHPQETLLISSFSGGEVFRSGMTWTRGAGRIFYFRPGHETYPTYRNEHVIKILNNAVTWAAPSRSSPAQYGRRDTGWMEKK